MKDIIKITKSLEDSRVWIYEVTETVRYETGKQESGFLAVLLAQRMLKSAEEKLDIVIEKGDMMSVKVAREMIAQANGKSKVQQSIECSTLKLEVA